MVYEFWTSETTGHRRTGTKLSEMRRLFERNISTAAILETLMSCSATASAQDMFTYLLDLDFDVAGVKEQKDGPLVGYVNRTDLTKGLVGDHVRPFEERFLIADSTPLADTIKLLSQRDFQFVLVGPEVRGIVVTADLNKPPVRIFLFGLISMLEMHMTSWIKIAYEGDGWTEVLAGKRLREAKRIFEDRKSSNTEITLLSCLQFCDKRDLFLKNGGIRSKLEIDGRKTADQVLKRAERLRNHLAHSQDDLASGTNWPQIAETVGAVEHLLMKSDEMIERDLVRDTAEGQPVLW